VLDLPAPSDEVHWTQGLVPGRYLLRYRSGQYSAEALAAARLELLPTVPAGERSVEWSELELSVAVRNVGGEDARRVPIELSATLDGDEPIPLGWVRLDVPSGQSASARFTWTPPRTGEWLIEATAEGVEATAAPITVSVESAPPSHLQDLLGVQGLEPRAATLVGSLLAVAVLLAGGLGLHLWRGSALSASPPTTAARHEDGRRASLLHRGGRDGMTGPSEERG
jgi:hypothetical protein